MSTTRYSFSFLQLGDRVIEYPHVEIDHTLTYDELVSLANKICISLTSKKLCETTHVFRRCEYTSDTNGGWNVVFCITMPNDKKTYIYILHRAADQERTFCGPIKHGEYQHIQSLLHFPLNYENVPTAYKDIQNVLLSETGASLINSFNLN
jgi:hypothetical protein